MKPQKQSDSLSRKDQCFYDKLYRSLHKRLLEYGHSVCPVTAVVEDSLHEIFEYFLQDTSKFDHVDNIEGYLRSSLRHEIIKTTKKRRKIIQIDDRHARFQQDSIEFKIIEKEDKTQEINKLRNALEQLSACELKAIRSRFFEHRSYEEIASINNSTKRTVYNQVHSGIRKLKSLISFS